MSQRITIKDVASRAKVSPTTVSLILNGKTSAMPEETCKRVRQAAQELNYRPNQLAQGLVLKKTKTIGLIIPDNDNIFFSTYSNSLMKAATRLGYNLILGNANNDVHRVVETLHIFEDRLVDAIILAQSEFPDKADSQACYAAIAEIRVPVLLIDRLTPNVPYEYVVLDHFAGGYMAAKYLLDMGHRRIGFITGPLTFSSCASRLAGYQKALEDFQIPFDKGLTYEGSICLETGSRSLPSLLGQSCTAICAFNDMMAYGIFRELHTYGLSVPGDISVIGFDDLMFSDLTSPPLTTVAQPLEEMSCFLMEHLDRRISAPREGLPPVQQIFTPVLKVRGSVKPYRSSRT